MTVHREQGRFVVRVELGAEFDADYEGDADGYAWLEAWKARVAPRIVKAVFAELRAEPGYSSRPASRGKSPDEEVEIDVVFSPRARP